MRYNILQCAQENPPTTTHAAARAYLSHYGKCAVGEEFITLTARDGLFSLVQYDGEQWAVVLPDNSFHTGTFAQIFEIIHDANQ